MNTIEKILVALMVFSPLLIVGAGAIAWFASKCIDAEAQDDELALAFDPNWIGTVGDWRHQVRAPYRLTSCPVCRAAPGESCTKP